MSEKKKGEVKVILSMKIQIVEIVRKFANVDIFRRNEDLFVWIKSKRSFLERFSLGIGGKKKFVCKILLPDSSNDRDYAIVYFYHPEDLELVEKICENISNEFNMKFYISDDFEEGWSKDVYINSMDHRPQCSYSKLN